MSNVHIDDPARADNAHPRVERRTLTVAVTRALLVVLVACLTLLAVAPPVAAEPRANEAFRRTLWNDFDEAAHWDELVREVVWGWSPHSGAEAWFEAVRRALWRDRDGAAHWDETLRRYFWDQQYPPPDSMLAAASTYQYFPDMGDWFTSATPYPYDPPGGGIVLGVTITPPNLPAPTVVLFPEAFNHGQAFLNYVVAHESGHLWAFDHDISAVIAAINLIPNPWPDYERYADCYAQKKGLTRPQGVRYWDCPASVLVLVTFT